MIALSPATRIFLAPGATDLRKSFEGLSDLVRHGFGQDPLSGHLFVFANRQRTRIKLLYWDGTGLWGCAKKLPQGTFHCPNRLSQGMCLFAWLPLIKITNVNGSVSGTDSNAAKSPATIYRAKQ